MLPRLFIIGNTHQQNLTCVTFQRLRILPVLNLGNCGLHTFIPFQLHHDNRIVGVFGERKVYNIRNPLPPGNSRIGLW